MCLIAQQWQKASWQRLLNLHRLVLHLTICLLSHSWLTRTGHMAAWTLHKGCACCSGGAVRNNSKCSAFLSLLETRTGLLWCFSIPCFIISITDVGNVTLPSYQSQLSKLFIYNDQLDWHFLLLSADWIIFQPQNICSHILAGQKCPLCQALLLNYPELEWSWAVRGLQGSAITATQLQEDFLEQHSLQIPASSWLLPSFHQQKTVLLGVTTVPPPPNWHISASCSAALRDHSSEHRSTSLPGYMYFHSLWRALSFLVLAAEGRRMPSKFFVVSVSFISISQLDVQGWWKVFLPEVVLAVARVNKCLGVSIAYIYPSWHLAS